MKNRWLIAASAVGIHISIGSIYAYSVLKTPLMETFGWERTAVSVSFSIAIFFLGISAAFMGHFVEKRGPRKAGTIAALFYGIGVLGSGLACSFAGDKADAVRAEAMSAHHTEIAAISLSEQDVVGREALTLITAAMDGAGAEASVADVDQTLDGHISAGTAAQADLGDDAEQSQREAIEEQLTVARKAKELFVTSVIQPATGSLVWLFYLFYGVMGGIGLGVGYISPVSTLVKWFPDRRGLATGLAIMGFGFASMIFAPTMRQLMNAFDLAMMFYILGAIYLVVMFASAQYLAPPPKDWAPAGFKDKTASNKITVRADLSQLTANEAIGTARFYYLWLMLFINVTCGIAVISVAAPMARESVGLSVTDAALMVGLMGLFNGIGRIGWASFSDVIGRANTYIAFFILQIAAFFLLPQISNAVLFQVTIFLILTCYGGGFASVPAFIGDLFGTKQLGAIHGYILTAWAAAGLVGPLLASWVRKTTNSYDQTLYIFAGLFVAALVVSLLMKLDIRRLRQRQRHDDTATTPAAA
ncbi:MAG: L-lactate MFS transporter [Planctomycetota bacterium]|jgi:OFA family oxalate/formate antiporter-like MFS transporter